MNMLFRLGICVCCPEFVIQVDMIHYGSGRRQHAITCVQLLYIILAYRIYSFMKNRTFGKLNKSPNRPYMGGNRYLLISNLTTGDIVG